MSTGSYYERIDEHGFKPTAHASGAWSTDEVHFSPLGGLITHAIELHLADRPGVPLLLSRISFDILGRLRPGHVRDPGRDHPARPHHRTGRSRRPHRRPSRRARPGLVPRRGRHRSRCRAAGTTGSPLPANSLPGAWASSGRAATSPRSTSARSESPSRAARPPGSPRPSTSSRANPAGPLASYVALVDTANGIAVREQPTAWMFPNVDLTIHLHRFYSRATGPGSTPRSSSAPPARASPARSCTTSTAPSAGPSRSSPSGRCSAAHHRTQRDSSLRRLRRSRRFG